MTPQKTWDKMASCPTNFHRFRASVGATRATSCEISSRAEVSTKRIKLDAAPFARYVRDPTQSMISSIRKYVAVDNESPNPVPTATYAARHAGHFGKSARMALGTIHPAMSRQRRVNVGAAGR